MRNKLGNYLVVLALMAGSFGVGMGVQPLQVAAQTRSFSTFLQVYDLVKSEFLDAKVEESKLEYGAIRGMLDSLEDPYTRFMEPKSFKSMQEERHGAFGGIGIQIGMRDKHLAVISPMEDTPAYKAGLRAGDHIMEVDGKSTKDMAIEEAVTLIRGPKGSKVTLTIGRDGVKESLKIAIVRDNIVTKAVKTKDLQGNIGYIRLTSFMSETADTEMRKALEKYKNSKGLILDLRSNPGGLLPNAVNIGSMFIKSGPIVQIVDREGNREKLNASGRPIVAANKPMVVLVDGGSASASEILAGALQDTKRAKLVGTKTFGKGLVQTVHALEGGAGVAITTNKYLTSAGNDINKKGIVPDVVIEFPQPAKTDKPEELPTLDEMIDQGKDVQLEKAKEILGQMMSKN
ncbi:Carboxy-terminal processing protease CtpA precursor [compost metagenome]